MKKFIYVLAALLLSQCKTSSNKSGMGGLAEIDISKKYPVKELHLQDITQIEYIPLETNLNTLMRSSARIVYVSDNYIVASNTSDGDVFVFDGKGKSKFSFNRKGQSGTDYNQLYSIAFDEKEKEIYIFDQFAANPKFLVYAEDGEFKRTFVSSSNFSPRFVGNFDDATLFAYDVYGLSQDRYSSKPYLLISKTDGTIVDTLDIHLPVRVSDRKYFEVEVNGQKGIMPISLSTVNNRSYGKNFLIADWSSDTIYKLTSQRELQPVIVRKPSVQNSEPKTIISNELVTNKYIFLTKAIFDFDLAKSKGQFLTTNLMYDFENGQINEYKLVNKDFESINIEFREAITPENIGVCLLDVAVLFEKDEAGKIKGELKQLLKSLKEEDNPVLMKVKF